MKTRNLLLGLLTCAAFSACSSEEVANVSQGGQGREAYLRVKIDLTGSGLSGRAERDGGYVQGIESEHKISNAFFAIYDKDGKWYAGSQQAVLATTNSVNHSGESTNNDEAVTEAVIILELEEAPSQSETFQLVVYANIIDEEIKGKSLTEALDLQLNAASVADFSTENKFPMTNSTYLYSDKMTYTTKFSGEAFKTSQDDANASAIVVHVERLAAKVKVSLKQEMTKTEHNLYNSSNASDNSDKLTFYPSFYCLNATNLSSYYLKHLDNSWTSSSFNNWEWNKSSDYRCFWAMDVNYEKEIGRGNDVSYTEISLDADGNVRIPTSAVSFGENNNGTYCLENTFTGGTYHADNTNKFEVATHVLIFGQYKNSEDDESGTTFYNYIGRCYKEEDLLSLWVNNQGVVFKKEGDNYSSLTDTECFEIISAGDMSGVTLALKEPSESSYYVKVDNDYVEIGEEGNENATLDKVNASLKKVYTAEGYRNGWAYFAVPIEHLGPAKEGEYDGTGSFGVVRNHSYELTINAIKNLGTGIYNIEDNGEEIIPDEEKIKYYVSSTLSILSWKKVSQGVEL